MDIVPLFDGELIARPRTLYPFTMDVDWVDHRRWLDEDGNYRMPFGAFLVRSHDRLILIDAGLGPYRFDGPDGGSMWGGNLLEELRGAGVSHMDITDVVLTHLHFDHVGWTVQSGEPVFPRATYRCHEDDWDYFNRTDAKARAKLAPLTDRLTLWAGMEGIAPGLTTLPTPGHTPGHTAIVVSEGTERVILLGDAAHCPAEMEESEWDGIADVDPLLARRTRAALAREIESSGSSASGPHFPGLPFGRMVRAQGRLRWVF